MTSRLARRLSALLVLGVAGYYALWGGTYSAFDLFRLRREIDDARMELARTRTEVDTLRAVVDRLENDPETIERVARERFGMIRQGELLYRFVEVDPAPANAPRVAGGP